MAKIKNYKEIPEGLATRPVWRARGYKPKSGEKPKRYHFWNGMHYINLECWSVDQCEFIRGWKAKERRAEYYGSNTACL